MWSGSQRIFVYGSVLYQGAKSSDLQDLWNKDIGFKIGASLPLPVTVCIDVFCLTFLSVSASLPPQPVLTVVCFLAFFCPFLLNHPPIPVYLNLFCVRVWFPLGQYFGTIIVFLLISVWSSVAEFMVMFCVLWFSLSVLRPKLRETGFVVSRLQG